jgi:hypothetical protein
LIRGRVEDGSRGTLIAFDVNEPQDVVDGEHARRQPENYRGVTAHNGVELATVMPAHLKTCVRCPNLD